MKNTLITPLELVGILDEVVVLDATMGQGVGGAPKYIKGAKVFDVEAVSDGSSPYPHTMPPAKVFADYVGRLGVGNGARVVVYDQTGVSFAAAQAWWMFRCFGHENVQVLAGGLPEWMKAGFECVEAPCPDGQAQEFVADFRPELYASYEQVVEASVSGDSQIIDVRGAGRFQALARTMDGDLVPAHVEGSVNLPFAAVLEPDGGNLLSNAMLENVFKHYLPQTDKPRIVMCGSGITACVVVLAFFQTGERNVAVFDGSWIEWADKEYIR